MSRRGKIAATAVALSLVLIAVSYTLSKESGWAITFFDRGSEWWPFTFQNAQWVAFFLGLGELYYRRSYIQDIGRGLSANYLSDRPDIFYDTNDLAKIRENIREKRDPLARLIDTLTIRYQVSARDVSETHQMLNSQLELMQFRLDVDYAILRYLVWLLPSLGFLGTVYGISLTLSAAGVPGAAQANDFLHILTKNLAVAFDTTLVGLIMSTILVYLMSLMQTREERGIEQCGRYCLDNLINKMVSHYDGKM